MRPSKLPVLESLSLGETQPCAWSFFRACHKKFSKSQASFFFQRSEKIDGQLRAVESTLAFDPYESLIFEAGRGQWRNSLEAREVSGDPFSALAERVEVHAHPHLKISSALGYFAYDAVRFLEAKNLENSGTFLSAAKGIDAEFFFFRKVMVFDHQKKVLSFCVVPEQGFNEAGKTDPSPSQITDEIAEMKLLFQSSRRGEASDKTTGKTTTKATSKSPDDAEITLDEMTSALGKERFCEGVKKLKAHIRAGDIFQAVLSEEFRLPFAADSFELFESLASTGRSPYEFYFSSGERVFLGASPEMLLRVCGDQLETHPIAGTRPRGADLAEELKLEKQLLASVKEKAEHLMLVDLARNDIGRVSEPGTVSLSSYMEIHKFGGVMHLVSKVLGKLKKGISPLQALASCFPAGTLSGAPKIRAMQLLSEIEAKPRGFYGGAVVAAQFNGDLESCISIRSVKIENQVAIVQAGAGVVADSRPEKEYAEVEHKTLMMRKALARVLGKNKSVL